jgi:hypothetical protein
MHIIDQIIIAILVTASPALAEREREQNVQAILSWGKTE